MPRGVPNNKKTVVTTPSAAPEPLIIMHPAGDGWQFNAYGIDLPEVIRALRLSLIHFAAQQAGVTTIEATISPRNALLATPAPIQRAAAKPKPAQRSANGRRTAARDYAEDEDLDEIDMEELMEAR